MALQNFINALNVAKEGLPCFAVFREVETEMIFDSPSPPQIQRGFIVSLKPFLNWSLLRWLKPRPNLVSSFIPYKLKIPKILLDQGLVNSKSLYKECYFFRIFYFPAWFIPLNYWRGKKWVLRLNSMIKALSAHFKASADPRS